MANNSRQNRLEFGDGHSAAEQGLKVVTAQFKGVEPFSWNIFDGFDRIRVLTYSASAQTIVRMLERYPFVFFECIVGYEEALRQIPDLVKSHQLLNNPVRDYTLQLENEWQRVIFERLQDGTARFSVVKDTVAHAKLYLLETNGGERRRAIVGSANLSERAFGGKQPETLVVFDNDAQAWEHYSREYNAVKEIASEIDMPVEPRPFLNSVSIKRPPTAAGMGGPTDAEKRRQLEAAIPKRAELKIPILKLLEYEALTQSEFEERLAVLFNLTKEERDYRPYENNQNTLFYNEIWGAKDILKKEGLIEFGRGRPARLTAQGRSRLRALS